MSEIRRWLGRREVLYAIAVFLMAFVSSVAVGIFLYGFVTEAQAGGIDLGLGVRDANAATRMGVGGLVMLVVLVAVLVLWIITLRRELRCRRRNRELERGTQN
jgi:UDP-N-acetylmuramyl pentapeptide phosphotransferase/UDP-N-acetylglucosamine-1-phosphate transferase